MLCSTVPLNESFITHRLRSLTMAEELDLPWCFDDEHLAWQKTIQEFGQRVVAPDVVRRDLEGRFDPDLIREVGRLGAFGLRVPEPYGGSGPAPRPTCIARAE